MIPAVVSLSRSPLCSSCRQSFTRRGLATSFLLIRAKRVGADRKGYERGKEPTQGEGTQDGYRLTLDSDDTARRGKEP